MSINQEMFEDWKRNPITQYFFTSIIDRVTAIKDDIATSAGLDALNDRHKVGYLMALQDILNLDYTEESDND